MYGGQIVNDGVQITSRTNFYCRDTSDLKVKQEAPSEKVKHGITL